MKKYNSLNDFITFLTAIIYTIVFIFTTIILITSINLKTFDINLYNILMRALFSLSAILLIINFYYLINKRYETSKLIKKSIFLIEKLKFKNFFSVLIAIIASMVIFIELKQIINTLL